MFSGRVTLCSVGHVQWAGHIMFSGRGTLCSVGHVQWAGHIIDWTYIDDLERQDNYSNHKVGSTHRLQQNREIDITTLAQVRSVHHISAQLVKQHSEHMGSF